MLAKAIGYKGYARYITFQRMPYGDQAEYSDGRMNGNVSWHAFLAYIQHPAVSPFLEEYDWLFRYVISARMHADFRMIPGFAPKVRLEK